MEMLQAKLYFLLRLELHRPDKEIYALLSQYLMKQPIVIYRACRGRLYRDNIHDPLHLMIQIWQFIAGVSQHHSHIQNDSVLRAQSLVAQVIYL